MLQYNIYNGEEKMGRKRFEINTPEDSKNFYNYLCNHIETIRSEFYESNDTRYDDNFENHLLVIFEDANEIAFDDPEHRGIQTDFLYLLTKDRINKIRTTIRMKRMQRQKEKKQLTISNKVHSKLKMYAEEHNQTFSDAIEHLLDSCYEKQ